MVFFRVNPGRKAWLRGQPCLEVQSNYLYIKSLFYLHLISSESNYSSFITSQTTYSSFSLFSLFNMHQGKYRRRVLCLVLYPVFYAIFYSELELCKASKVTEIPYPCMGIYVCNSIISHPGSLLPKKMLFPLFIFPLFFFIFF